MHYSGTQLLDLYNIPSISPLPNVRKPVIAIVVAYHYDNLLTDLATYWKNAIHYGPNSTPPQVKVHNLNSTGSTSSSKSISSGWALEECLDLQMVCMVAPNASIQVIEANSDSCTDLNAAVQYALGSKVLADVVSMSWGGADTTSMNSYASIFTSTQNVCFCASSGDSNAASWPSVLANCISVGGTTLVWTPTLAAPSMRTEYCWPTAGCGYSTTVSKPIYQNAVNSTAFRSIPDISLIANPQTSVYVVYNNNWYGLGGTSVSTPIFSATLALANQQRLNSGKVTLTSIYSGTSTKTNHVQTRLYNIVNTNTYSQVFNDITVGQDQGSTSSGGTTVYNTGVNYDIATGLGSPNASALISFLNSV
jgi:subtilase family serine protease